MPRRLAFHRAFNPQVDAGAHPWGRIWVSDPACKAISYEVLTEKTESFRLLVMTRRQIHEAASWMGRRGYQVRLEKYGIERLREIARQNGRKGGRPRREPAQAAPRS